MPPNFHAAAISSLALCFWKRLLLANALECGSFIKLGQLGNIRLSSKARSQLLPAAHNGVHYILLRKKQQLSGSGMTSQVLCRASGELMDSEGGYSDIDAGSSDQKVMIRSKRVHGHDVGMDFEGDSLASSVKEQAPTVCRPVAQVGGKRLAKQKRGNEESLEAFEGTESDEMFMREALLEAHLAAMKGEVPVGAVMVHSGRIIARAHNQVEAKGDPTAHAEMRCIQNASQLLGRWRLLESTLYVTLEPCPMCAGAILQARVGELVWGARNTLLGADGSWVSLFPQHQSSKQHDEARQSHPEDGPEQQAAVKIPIHPFHPNITLRREVLSKDCSEIMQSFFRTRRKFNSSATTRRVSNERFQHRKSIISFLHICIGKLWYKAVLLLNMLRLRFQLKAQ